MATKTVKAKKQKLKAYVRHCDEDGFIGVTLEKFEGGFRCCHNIPVTITYQLPSKRK